MTFRSGNIYPTGINIVNGACELFESFHPHCSGVLSVSLFC